ncbi:hypothetical protein [Edaphobacter modestus]|uniref:Uncharacterized protein n=1 Tax=Edaphobacter modestus TaxID=388466 RepID=A0A4V2G346_9BACT|nr:hypothetical protein [Edaphobacter modestus]RZU35626.1 hypothetical protein BDD14_5710 [Edaphobacter modestus]
MARKLKWRHDLHNIMKHVENSKTETWRRVDLEIAFNVSRPAAQRIMRAIGNIDNIGGTHAISRDSVITYLEHLIEAEDPTEAHLRRLQNLEPAPRHRKIQGTVPNDLHSVMVSSLPPNIVLKPGGIEVTGSDFKHVMENLLILARVLQNDTETAAQLIDPPKNRTPSIDYELKTMFNDLRVREAAYQAAQTEKQKA